MVLKFLLSWLNDSSLGSLKPQLRTSQRAPASFSRRWKFGGRTYSSPSGVRNSAGLLKELGDVEVEVDTLRDGALAHQDESCRPQGGGDILVFEVSALLVTLADADETRARMLVDRDGVFFNFAYAFGLPHFARGLVKIRLEDLP